MIIQSVFRIVGVAVPMLMAASPAMAGPREMIPSCYAVLGISPPKSSLKREIFVVIDQTTPVDEAQRKALVNDVVTKFAPETAVTVLTFSAFISNKYADLVFSGLLDKLPSQDERDDMPKRKLRDLDRCHFEQAQYGKMRVAEAISGGFGKPADNIARSDIFSTLKDISADIVKASPAQRKDVLLISDMLENSSLTSFYQNNAVRRIEPNQELGKVQGFGDFGGATIYVAGAGSIVTAGRAQVETYRDPKTMEALEIFWKEYFVRSNAKLEVFGKPALMSRF